MILPNVDRFSFIHDLWDSGGVCINLGHQAISSLLGLGSCFETPVPTVLGFSNAGRQVAVLVLRAMLIGSFSSARVATP